MSMPFKKRKFDGGSMSIQKQIKTLSRRVNANKPETQYIRANTTITPTTTGVFTSSTDITALFTADVNKFQGQKFRNLWTKFRIDPLINASRCRIVVYRPKKPSETFVPTSNEFVAQADPEKYVVYYDKAFQPTSSDARGRFQDGKINFKGLLTTYDNTGASLQEGQLRMTFITQGDNASSALIGWLFAYQDV